MVTSGMVMELELNAICSRSTLANTVMLYLCDPFDRWPKSRFRSAQDGSCVDNEWPESPQLRRRNCTICQQVPVYARC